MRWLLLLIFSTLGSYLGWYIGAGIGIMGAYFASCFGAAVGWYGGHKLFAAWFDW